MKTKKIILYATLILIPLINFSFNIKPVTLKKLEMIEDFDLAFEGEINKKYTICLELKNVSGKLSGSLTYQGQSSSLTVDGTIDEKGNVVINEYNAKGKNTGIFKGQYKDEEFKGIKGTWSKPDGTSPMPFDIYESEGEETFCAGVRSNPGDWSGTYKTKENKILEIKGPDSKGHVQYTIVAGKWQKSGTAYLVAASKAEYLNDDTGCDLLFHVISEGEIEVIKMKGGSTTLCDVFTGVYTLKK